LFWLNLLLLAAGALGLSWNTQVLMNCNEVNLICYPICAALFTVLAYLVMRSRLLFKHQNEMPASLPVKTTVATIIAVAFVTAILLFQMFNKQLFQLPQMIVCVVTFVLSFFYFIPLNFSKNGKRLRDIYWLKHFVVGLNWSLATVALPCGFSFSNTFWGFFLQVFFLIAALSLSFDLRDARLDEIENHQSFLLVKGEKKLKLVCGCLLFCCAVLLIFFSPTITQVILTLLLLVIIFFIIIRIKPNDHSAKFNVLLESAILLFAILGMVF
jgi:hypothetical protein